MLADRRKLFAIAGGLALVLAGVVWYAGTTSTGTLRVLVKDAPAEWAHVNVTFSEVRVHRANASEESGWHSLALETTTIDFIELGNLTKVLALDRVPAGKYTQIRIVVAKVEGTFADGERVTLTVPDGILKTTTPFDLLGGGEATLTLDFDLSRSILDNASGWTFKPVLGSIQVS